jgi:hypothetical protein
MRRRPAFRRAGRLAGLAALAAGCALLLAAAAIGVSQLRDTGPPAPPVTRVGGPASTLTRTFEPAPSVARPPRAAGTEIVRRRRPPSRPAEPTQVVIPAIGVRARIVRLGLNPDRSLEVPKDFDEAGWWSGGRRPGERGPAVIAGHVDGRAGPAVFYRLGDLRPGNAVIVLRRDGTRTRFTVQRLERHPKAAFPTARVYGATPRPTLRLITCGGEFDRSTGHYVDNTIVFAVIADRD